jgi:NAD(P)-dependent dehydrogenase (short-subunit alcohol dehydrogenase family)
VKIAVVTGGGKGIGFAIAKEFVSDGWQVVITGRDESALHEASRQLGGAASCLVMDVQNTDSVNAAFDDIANQHARIDSLVNCAGVIVRKPIEEMSDEDWATVIETDLSGVFRCARAASPLLQSGGTVVNIGSIAGGQGIAARTGYTSAKAGLEGLTRTLALEWASRGIRVNNVAPGWTRTEMVDRGIHDGRIDEALLTSRIALGRIAEPREIADVVLFLASQRSTYITGQTITVDGGITINGNT